MRGKRKNTWIGLDNALVQTMAVPCYAAGGTAAAAAAAAAAGAGTGLTTSLPPSSPAASPSACRCAPLPPLGTSGLLGPSSRALISASVSVSFCSSACASECSSASRALSRLRGREWWGEGKKTRQPHLPRKGRRHREGVAQKGRKQRAAHQAPKPLCTSTPTRKARLPLYPSLTW